MNKTFCTAPFIHQVHDYLHGCFHLCCAGEHAWNGFAKEKLSMKSSALDVWNSTYMNNIRRDMLEGRHIKGCEKCYNQEQNTGNSDRLEKWNKPKYMDPIKKNEYKPVAYPTHIEHRPGNLCNLKCRMCNEEYSNIWEKEIERYRHDAHPDKIQGWLDDRGWGQHGWESGHKPKEFKFEYIKNFIPTLKDIRFLGGEAMLSSDVDKLIDYCIEKDYAKNISIEFTTNGTKITDEYLKRLLNFKTISIQLSIDGTDKTFNYVRTLAYFNKVEENLFKCIESRKIYPEKINVRILYASQLYNIENLPQFIKWHLTLPTIDRHHLPWGSDGRHFFPLSLDLVIQPEELCVNLLPKHTKKHLYNEITSAIKEGIKTQHERTFYTNDTRISWVLAQLLEDSDTTHAENFKTYTNLLDNRRNTDLHDVSPLVAKAMNYSKIKY